MLALNLFGVIQSFGQEACARHAHLQKPSVCSIVGSVTPPMLARYCSLGARAGALIGFEPSFFLPFSLNWLRSCWGNASVPVALDVVPLLLTIKHSCCSCTAAFMYGGMGGCPVELASSFAVSCTALAIGWLLQGIWPPGAECVCIWTQAS